MLKNIDPILNADVLHALQSMGHGDYLVICDANFPTDSVATETVLGQLLRLDGVDAPRVTRAILSLMPLDSFVDHPVSCMQVIGKPNEVIAVRTEVQAEVDAAVGASLPIHEVERFAFYEMAKRAYCVIQTGERRFYGNFVFQKGVIPPDA